jgi:hypothetical protein
VQRKALSQQAEIFCGGEAEFIRGYWRAATGAVPQPEATALVGSIARGFVADL